VTRAEMSKHAIDLIADLIGGGHDDQELAQLMIVTSAHLMRVGTYLATEAGLDVPTIVQESLDEADRVHHETLGQIDHDQQPN